MRVNSFTARMISDGRLTVPEELREILKLKKGDLVEVQISKIWETEGVRSDYSC